MKYLLTSILLLLLSFNVYGGEIRAVNTDVLTGSSASGFSRNTYTNNQSITVTLYAQTINDTGFVDYLFMGGKTQTFIQSSVITGQ